MLKHYFGMYKMRGPKAILWYYKHKLSAGSVFKFAINGVTKTRVTSLNRTLPDMHKIIIRLNQKSES